MLLLYILYLWFQLRTHHNLFGAEAAASADYVESQSASGPVAEPAHDSEDESESHMSPWAAGGVLIVTTVLVSICADYLVDSIDSLVERAGLSRNFIGLILIPIVGNAAEHVTAVVVAIKNKMDLAMGVAIGSSIQISLFVTPFLVILGWIMHRPMDLHFETCKLGNGVFVVYYFANKSCSRDGSFCSICAGCHLYGARRQIKLPRRCHGKYQPS